MPKAKKKTTTKKLTDDVKPEAKPKGKGKGKGKKKKKVVREEISKRKGRYAGLTNKAKIDLVISDLNAKAGGAATINRASDVWTPFHIRRPTGITSVDMSIGGGFAAGTISQLFGKEGSGKNYIFDCAARELQKNYGDEANIAVASFGYGWDKKFSRMNGVAVAASNIEIEMLKDELADHGEELPIEVEVMLRQKIGEFCIIGLQHSDKAFEMPAETTLQMVVDAIGTGVFQLILLDETNMGETCHAADTEFDGDEKVANFASLMTKFLKRFYNAIKFNIDGEPNQTSLINILEARIKIGGFSPSGEALEQGAGMALRHAKAVDLHMRGGSQKIDDSKVMGKQMHWRVSKGKMGCHEGGNGELYFGFFDSVHGPRGVDQARDIVEVGLQMGIISKAGSWYSLDSDRIGQGAAKAADWMRERPSVMEQIRKDALRGAGVSTCYRA
jgi:hypothetical protein